MLIKGACKYEYGSTRDYLVRLFFHIDCELLAVFVHQLFRVRPCICIRKKVILGVSVSSFYFQFVTVRMS